MAECETKYPGELPLACIHTLITIARAGEIPERAVEFAAAAWSVTGYCLKVFLGEPSPVINGPPPAVALPSEARQQIAELAELLSAVSAERVGSQLSVFLRTVVVPALVAALKKLLEALSE